MNKLLLFAPQWQDSGLTNEIYKGSCALKDYCESLGSCKFVKVPVDASTVPVLKNNIFGHDLLKDQLNRIERILKQKKPKKIFALGGGCGIEVPIVSYFNEINGNNLSLFWFDAHGDLNTPKSSPSRHFHGMSLRFITERIKNNLYRQRSVVPASKVTLLGTRDLDKPEKEYIDKEKINILSIDGNNFVNKVKSHVKELNGPVYIHIDLDVIDPNYYLNVKCPAEKGLTIAELEKSIRTIQKKLEVVGLSIVENTEQNDAEIRKLKKIIQIGFEL